MIPLLDLLAERPVIAVFRAPNADHFAEAASIICEAGINAMEFTLTTQGASDAIAQLRAAHPEVVVGAGTVRDVRHVHEATSAGAQFLVSQLFAPEVAGAAAQEEIPFVPGSLTPNEIVRAWEHGVQAVKVSPIGPLGGIRYLNELRGPLPEIPLIPTGGVEIDEVGAYLSAGAVAVGISRALFGDCLSSGDFGGLAARAHRAVESLDAGRALLRAL